MDRLTAMTVFVEVAQRGSVTAAAQALEISRPMATRYLAELENWLGARLFHRTTRRIALTSAGEEALQRCRQLLDLGGELRAAVGAQGDPREQGQLRLTCSSSFGQSQLAAAVAAYARLHPGVRIDMLLLDRTVDLVEERIDLAIRIAHELDPGLVARKLSVCRSLLCASPAYLRERGAPKRPEDLAGHDCLSHHFVGKTRWRLSRRGQEVEMPVRGGLASNDAAALMAAAREGMGIAMLPTYLIAEALRGGELSVVLPDWQVPEMGVFGVYASRRLMPPIARSFLDFLVERFGAAPPWDREPARPAGRRR
ncbi:LysR family transcriptional regulator [Lysobacter sp. K5869]|uniref:LysR family transcriptional regulator n=1 Tax=Lysobacter sp. K5869 TaxID=2820808 RepID=UPI001C060FBD|nr:LysR family transcriptional regulator [Lysobacter sp. K5869]QWP75424.1 LysR family transcriptional regulator [Lysobacter sp. K5869]